MGASESKLAFRRNVFRLYEERNIPVTDDAFWSTFTELPVSAEDVFGLFNPQDIRSVRDKAPENLKTLLKKVLETLFTKTDTINIATATARFTDSDTKIVNNALRILTRLLPYLFEVPDALLENDIFWNGLSHSNSNNSDPSNTTNASILPDTTGAKLVSTVLHLLFCQGYTLPEINGERTNFTLAIWRVGLGASSSPSSTAAFDQNRTEVLRLLLVILSKWMYFPPQQILYASTHWTAVLETPGIISQKHVLTLLCSLINTVLSYDPVGWGLPYNHVLFSDSQESLAMVSLHVMLALLAYGQTNGRRESMIVPPTSSENLVPSNKEPKGKEKDTGEQENHDVAPNLVSSSKRGSMLSLTSSIDSDGAFATNNVFRYYLGKIHRSDDFTFLLTNILRLLKNPIQATNTYLPGSTKRVVIHGEVLMLFWKFIEVNERFLKFVTESPLVLELFSCVAWYGCLARVDSAKTGVLRLCCFLIHIFSAERSFSIQLNTSLANHLTIFQPRALGLPTFHNGTYGDLLVLTIYTLLSSSRQNLPTNATVSNPPAKLPSNLHETLLIALSNVAPYLKDLNVVSATKLVESLVSQLGNPRYLFAAEGNHRLIFYVFETLNALIGHGGGLGGGGNVEVMYALIRSRDKIFALRDLSLESFIEKEMARNPDLAADESVNIGLGSIGSLANLSPTTTMGNGDIVSEHDTHIPLPRTRESSVSVNMAVKKLMQAKNAKKGGSNQEWYPTQEWFEFWHSRLPLTHVLSFLDHVGPKLDAKLGQDAADVDLVTTFLQTLNLVGVMPPLPPVFVRRFVWSDGMCVWFSSFFWGVVYLRYGLEAVAADASGAGKGFVPTIWSGTDVKLFQIKVSEA